MWCENDVHRSKMPRNTAADCPWLKNWYYVGCMDTFFNPVYSVCSLQHWNIIIIYSWKCRCLWLHMLCASSDSEKNSLWSFFQWLNPRSAVCWSKQFPMQTEAGWQSSSSCSSTLEQCSRGSAFSPWTTSLINDSEWRKDLGQESLITCIDFRAWILNDELRYQGC